jgi:AbrB family looped-hinge helix DNA binding protein
MQVVIDKFGRVVIPKATRTHLGILEGSAMELKEQEHSILLILKDQEPPLKRNNGILIYTGEATDNIEDAVYQDRSSRIKALFK